MYEAFFSECNWLTFYSPFSFASQGFPCFATYSFSDEPSIAQVAYKCNYKIEKNIKSFKKHDFIGFYRLLYVTIYLFEYRQSSDSAVLTICFYQSFPRSCPGSFHCPVPDLFAAPALAFAFSLMYNLENDFENLEDMIKKR